MKRNNLLCGAVLLGITLFCTSCMVGRRQIKSPDLKLPSEIVQGKADSLTLADLAWWNIYTDSTLTALIERTLAYNKDLLMASARVQRMQALSRSAKADRLPSITGSMYAETEHNDYKGSSATDDPEIGAKARLAWELDLWGNLRWANRQAAAEYLSSVEAQRAMQMTLVAEVATAYYELVALDQELAIVRRTLATRKEGVRQARLRFEGGLTSETALQQAKVELASTATLIPGLESQIALKEHQIAVLAGEYPSMRINRQTMEWQSHLPEEFPVGLPSELLKRRPDLRQSEQDLRAAEAALGVAYADRFPRITFEFVGGWENGEFAGLFSSPFSYLQGGLVSPLFSFGKKKARHHAAVAACEEARLNYEQKVLEAFREVNDAVVSYSNVRSAASLKRDLQQAAQKYVELAQLQYFNGVINYLDVLDAQRNYFDAQIGLSNAVRDEYLALVNLYKALGGGWGVERSE
ncbi:efflux transporter outer membrane subunit [uncultured Alistipes sp.]|uniref:efflux transporter outer membrane subunit n=1 Tax=uncultured Alistipes sp. TaxID=538949 RepID=UPI00263137FD|nr:efflux transporter outer membrane subunit [uncultured Alistipes sp.]